MVANPQRCSSSKFRMQLEFANAGFWEEEEEKKRVPGEKPLAAGEEGWALETYPLYGIASRQLKTVRATLLEVERSYGNCAILAPLNNRVAVKFSCVLSVTKMFSLYSSLEFLTLSDQRTLVTIFKFVFRSAYFFVSSTPTP